MHTHPVAPQGSTGNASLAETIKLGSRSVNSVLPIVQALVINHPAQATRTLCDVISVVYGLVDQLGLLYGTDVVDLAQTMGHAIPKGVQLAQLIDQCPPACLLADAIMGMDDEQIPLYLYSFACVSFALRNAQRQLSLAKN